MMRSVCALLGALLLAAGAALAQAPAPKAAPKASPKAPPAPAPGAPSLSGAFLDLLQSPPHQQAVLDFVKAGVEKLPSRCPQVELSPIGLAAIAEPPEFDTAGRPTKGAWKEAVRADGCKTSWTYNVLNVVVERELKLVWLPPGTTRVDPLLLRDVLPDATAATHKAAGCTDPPLLADTRFERYEGNAIANARSTTGETRPWRETWHLAACGKTVDMVVHFVPDPKGTGFQIKPNEVKAK